MYTMVLMMAVTGGGETASFGKNRGCNGGSGAVVYTSSCTGWGSGYGAPAYGGCYGSNWGGSSCNGRGGLFGGGLFGGGGGLFGGGRGLFGGGLFGRRGNDCCPTYSAPAYMPAATPCCAAPVVAQPVYTGFTTACCDDPCERQGLFARLRARFGKNNCCAPTPCCGSYGGVAGHPGGCVSSFGTVLTPPPGTGVAPGGTTTPPQNMPTPTPGSDPNKEEPKKDAPKELTGNLPVVDAPRVPTLSGPGGKY